MPSDIVLAFVCGTLRPTRERDSLTPQKLKLHWPSVEHGTELRACQRMHANRQHIPSVPGPPSSGHTKMKSMRRILYTLQAQEPQYGRDVQVLWTHAYSHDQNPDRLAAHVHASVTYPHDEGAGTHAPMIMPIYASPACSASAHAQRSPPRGHAQGVESGVTCAELQGMARAQGRAGQDDARALPGRVLGQLAPHEEAQVLVETAHERGAGRDAIGVKRLARRRHVLALAQRLRARLAGAPPRTLC